MDHYFTNTNVKSNLKDFSIKILDRDFIFYTDNGVFSKRGLDFGSRLLIETVAKHNLSGDILEVGCGYGIVNLNLKSLVCASGTNKNGSRLSQERSHTFVKTIII